MANFFDQFDEVPTAKAGANFFDQFDPPPAAPEEMPVFDANGVPTGAVQAVPAVPPGSDAGPLAFWRGVGQGGTLGFGDEVYGAGAGVRSWMEGNGFQSGYDRAVAERRALLDQTARQNPIAYGVGQVAGGVAPMVGAAALAPTAFGVAPGMSMGQRALMSGVSSGAVGGVQGFAEGRGDAMQRLPSAGWGATTGAMMGTVAPIAGGVAGGVAQAGMNALATRGATIPGLGTRAANTIANAYRANPAGAVERRLAELGPDAMLADAAPNFTSITQGLATRPEGAARNIVVNALEARDAGTNARIAQSLDTNLGPAPVPSQVEAQFAARRAAAGRMYEAATSAAGPVDASNAIALIGQRLNTAEGAERAGLQRALDLLMPPRGPGGSRIVQSDARNLHSAKRALDDLIDYGDPQMGIPRGAFSSRDNAIHAVRRELNDALEAQVPRYGDINLMASTAHRASEALESGRAALRPDVHPADWSAAFSAAPIERQAAARAGMRADVDRVVGNQANDLLALRGTLKGEGDWNRAKAATAFGQEAVDRTVADLDREIAFRATRNSAVGGSNTANKTLGAEVVDVRKPAATRSDTDIAVGSLLGGAPGAAGAVAVRGARYGLGMLGRRSDIARNEQLARALVDQDPIIIDAVRRRAEAMAGENPSIGRNTAMLVQLLTEGSEREAEAPKEYARRLARALMAH